MCRVQSEDGGEVVGESVRMSGDEIDGLSENGREDELS